MRDCFEHLFEFLRPAFRQQRCFERARRLALSMLLCLGRHTVTGMLSTGGRQFVDWSADYRLFEQERINTAAMWKAVVAATLNCFSPQSPVVAAIDDTLVRKRGRRIAGTSWRRDPLGPHFADNFIWASRFLQLSIAVPEHRGPSPARMIPVDLLHCPSPRKPPRRASAEQWQQFKEMSKEAIISRKGARRMSLLRQTMDGMGMTQRPLIISADGTFTCSTVFKELPERTTLIGRLRKDARLHALPSAEQQNHGRGRRRAYGSRLATPEQMRRDESIPWQAVKAHAAGKIHTFDVKQIAPLRWKPAGGERAMRLLIIRPLAYRPRKGAHMDYRNPAYLITNDLSTPVNQLLQSYLWRWEIEVNFRDEKTLIGMGQAQVRTRASVETLTPFAAATYSLLLLALINSRSNKTQNIPPARWRKTTPHKHQRTSTAQAINILRSQVWAEKLAPRNKNSFATKSHTPANHKQIENSLKSAVLYASG